MDDWQDHALSTRHMHNRNSRRGSGKGKKSSQFDVRKTFGEYEVKCASWERALSELNDEDDDGGRGDDAAFELLRLTDDGQGVLGELVLPGVMTAAVVLAATRRGLTLLTRSLAGEEEEEEEGDKEDEDNENRNNNRHASSSSAEEQEEDEDEDENARLSTFEKNSFRTPKFWLAWNGVLTIPRPASPPPPSPTHTRKTGSSFGFGSDSPPPSPTLHRTGSSFPPPSTQHQHQHQQQQQQQVAAEGTGYIVFTGAECRKFKGTLSCVELGWRDVSVSGFKRVSRSQSDRRLLWGGRDVETGWREGVDGGGQEDRGARLDARRRVVFD